VIAEGSGLTVTTAVVLHPFARVYVIVAVPVTDPPVTMPEPVTLAVDVALEVQVAGPDASVSVLVPPGHSIKRPEIDDSGPSLSVIL
jgi:hypothetical protein